MHSFSLLVALVFALATTSYASNLPTLEVRKDRNDTHSRGGSSTENSCKELRKLTHLTSLAANQTKLDNLVASGKLDTAKVDELKTKAADAAPKLQALTFNSTLVTECATINANKHMQHQCKQMKRLQRLARLAGNATAVDAFAADRNLNATQVDGLKSKAQKADMKLKALEANATLTELCGQMKQAQQGGGDGGISSAGGAASGGAQQVATSMASGVRGMLNEVSWVFVPVVVGALSVLL